MAQISDYKKKFIDERFSSNQKKLEQLGHFTRDDERKTMSRERAEEEIRRIQSEQRKIIGDNLRYNRERGLKFNPN